ncbi:MAG TPA: hypothetical protein VGX25_27540 [Actinophytocola sp.]|uniref:DUF7919 family protein n=1 Tax=Actinophytocola sp. TaxID=1872138 RepID=UPI002DDD7BF1|nr:hypothetical protein [Actinophytocola sp.]HEV2783153.1 hypothetical protein [Actinophytocola sp.]
MTYFEDGSPYRYLPEFQDGSVNVGWLDAAEPYPTGDVPADFAERLVELCRNPVNRTRGWHYCNLCPRPAEPMPQPITVKSPEGDFPVGFAEIRVEGSNGVRYAAPDMIAHYVLEHRYRPPDAFIEAVRQQGDAS